MKCSKQTKFLDSELKGEVDNLLWTVASVLGLFAAIFLGIVIAGLIGYLTGDLDETIKKYLFISIPTGLYLIGAIIMCWGAAVRYIIYSVCTTGIIFALLIIIFPKKDFFLDVIDESALAFLFLTLIFFVITIISGLIGKFIWKLICYIDGMIVEHDWNGCKCSRCGRVRDEQHDWYGYKCRRCKKIRKFECKEKEHEWEYMRSIETKEVIGWHGESPYEAITYYDVYRCKKCGWEKNEKTGEYSPI